MLLWSETKTRTLLRKLITASTLFTLLFGDVSIVFAQTSLFNKQVNYQAKLMTASGVAVPDGTYNLWFRLYLAPVSATTTNIWEEQYIGANKASVTNGLLSVMLGSQTSLASLNWNQPLYLGVEIGGSTTPLWDGEMTPRKLLGAVPASFTTDTLDGLDSTQFVRTDGTSTIASSSAQTLLSLNQQGAGNILDLKAGNITLATFLASGNVGIGTTSPYAKLSVAGNVVASSFTATSTATSTFAGGISAGALAVIGSASSTFANGLNLTTGCYAVAGTCLADTTGITSLNGLSTLSQTFATSSDANLNLTITSAGSTHTFTPSWVGTLAATRGGTGISTITSSSLLIGGAGNSWSQVATSSLGLPTFIDLNSYLSLASWFATTTDGLAEGSSRLYFTNARADARINATDTLSTLFYLPNLVRSTTTSATSTNLFATNLSATGATTSALSTGVLSVTGSGTTSFGGAIAVGAGQGTSTFGGGLSAAIFIANSMNTNVLTSAQSTLGNATATTLFTTTASTTFSTSSYAFISNQLTATNGRFTTGLAITPITSCTGSQALTTDASGNVICGTISVGGASTGGGWTTNNTGLVTLATSTDRVGLGTSTPYAKLSVVSSNTASTTLALLPAGGATANILDVYNSAGTLTNVITANGALGIGTTTPSVPLEVVSAATGLVNIATFSANPNAIGAGALAEITINNTYGSGNKQASLAFASAGTMQWAIGNDFNGSGGQNFFIWDAIAGANRLVVDASGNVGIGTTSPYAKLSVAGSVVAQNYNATGTSPASGTGYMFNGTTLLTASTSANNYYIGGAAENLGAVGGSFYNNIAVGPSSMLYATSGYDNIAIGFSAQRGNSSSNGNTGYRNVTVGDFVSYLNTSGSNNSFFGNSSALSNTSGSQNSFFGYWSGGNNTTGSYNTALGWGVGVPSATGDRQLNIGNVLYGTNLYNGGTISAQPTTNGAISIGTSSPWARLSLQGSYGSTVTLFDIASSTNAIGSATTSIFRVLSSGALAMGSTTSANIFINGGGTTTNPLAVSGASYGRNIAIGNETFSYFDTTTGGASYNIAFGYQSLYGSSASRMVGDSNIGIGYQNLYSNTTGSYNIANGMQNLYSNTTGSYNIANGFGALFLNTTGYHNVANGDQALSSNTTGSYNIANGIFSLLDNVTGSHNTADGAFSLLHTTGASSTALGVYAGSNNITGSNNLFLGDNTDALSGGLFNASAIGSHALVAASSSLILGGTGTWNVNVGIGTSTPWAKLSIQNTYGSTTALFDIATTTTNTGATSSLFRINADGNIGIGTTSPQYKLDIAAAATSGIRVSNSNDTPWAIMMNNLSYGSGDTSGFGFWQSNSGVGMIGNSNVISALAIATNGNIGIGTTSPYAKLAVVGQVVAASFISTTTATSTFGGAITVGAGQGTSTFAGGLNLTAGCFSINSVCLSNGGSSASSTLLGDNNTFSGQNIFTNILRSTSTQATSTNFYANTLFASAATAGYFTATSTSASSTFTELNLAQGLPTNTTGWMYWQGSKFLSASTTAWNTIMGIDAGGNISGSLNTAIGYSAFTATNPSDNNTAIGAYSLANTTAWDNTGVGAEALFNTVGGSGNTALGRDALNQNISGDDNVAIGMRSGAGDGTRQDNRSVLDTGMTFLGAFASRDARISSTTVMTNGTAVGYTATVGCSNCLVLGGTGANAVNVGIGTSTPWAKLSIQHTYGAQTPLFDIATTTNSTGSATTSIFRVLSNGTLAMGSSTSANIFINGGGTTTNPLSLTATRNVTIGSEAFSYFTSGANDNIALGYRALYGSSTSLMIGNNNIAIGRQSLFSNTSGNGNTTDGAYSLFSNTTGSYNVANGYTALYSNTIGWYNTANGSGSLYSNTTGSRNTADGLEALYSNTTGAYNTTIGYQALYSNTTGASSTAIGANAGSNNVTGSNNIFLGDNTDVLSDGLFNASAIGSHALVAASSSLILGGTGTWNVNVGIGTSTPWAKLSIQNTYGSTTPLFDIATSTNASGSATSSLFRINADGNIGIGTTSPYAKLSIWGRNTSSSTKAFEVANNASSTLLSLFNDGSLIVGSTTAPFGRLNVSPNGNIGLGITPSATNGIGTSRFHLNNLPWLDGDYQSEYALTIDYARSTPAPGVATSTGIYLGQGTSASSGDQVGIFNNFGMDYSGSTAIGLQNKFYSNASGQTYYGVRNISTGPVLGYAGTNNFYGYANEFTENQVTGGTGSLYGLYNKIPSGYQYGYTTNIYGVYSQATTFSNGTRTFYGDYVESTATSTGGTQYGFYADLTAGTATKYPAILLGGNVGIGTSTPYAKLAVVGQVVAAFFTATTTATSTFGGAITVGAGQGTSTFAGGLSTTRLNVTSGTSTFANGLNLTAGCFSINSVCLSNGGSSASSTLLGDTNTFSGANNSFANLSWILATGTQATTTNFFAKNLFASAATAGYFTATSTATSTFFGGISSPGNTGNLKNEIFGFDAHSSSGIGWNTILGYGAEAGEDGNVVIGTYATATRARNVVIGRESISSGYDNVVVGRDNQALDYSNVIVGVSNIINANAFGGIAIGTGNDIGVNATGSVAMGWGMGPNSPDAFEYGNRDRASTTPSFLLVGSTNQYQGQDLFRIRTAWLDSTDVSRKGSARFSTFDTAEREFLRAESTGSGVNTSFLGGSVAIGTTSPWAKLSIRDTYGSTTALFDIATTTNAAGTATSSLFRVSHDGKVGIGASNPDYKLTISGNETTTGIGAVIRLNEEGPGSASSGGILFTRDSTAPDRKIGYIAFANAASIESNSDVDDVDAGSLSFMTNGAGGLGDGEVMRITSGQNVGIGTSTPWAKLSIQNTYSPQIPLFDVASSTNASGSATSSLFRINANGNIGVGTSSPYAKLSIAGQVVAAFFTATSTTATSSFQEVNFNAANAQNKDNWLFWGGTKFMHASSTAQNTSFGLNALAFGSSTENTAIGYSAMHILSESGSVSNTAVGNRAMRNATYGQRNVAIGNQALYADNGAGDRNAGVDNVAIGDSALYSSAGGGGGNVAIGSDALRSNDWGSGNTAVGNRAGYGDGTTVNQRSSIDWYATFVGYGSSRAGAISQGTQLENITAIGKNARVACSNCLVLGGTGADAVNVGIGTSTPWAKLSIQGTSSSTAPLFDVATSTNTIGSATSSLFRINANGRVGVGTTSPYTTFAASGTAAFTGTTTIGIQNIASWKADLVIPNGSICVDNDGSCAPTTTGQISARGYNTGASDLAENYFSTSTTIEAGDIVELAGSSTFVTIAEHASRSIGIISTKPGIILGADLDNVFKNRSVAVALSGRVPVKVNLENGPIHSGDRITLSSVPGVGARATATSSITLAIAMEDWLGDPNSMDTQSQGLVLSFVSLGYRDLSAHIQGSQFSLTSTSSGAVVPLFALSADDSAVKYIADKPFDFGGQALTNIKSLMSASGKWSLDENGALVVDSVNARTVTASEKICVQDVCVNRDQLNALLLNSGLGGGSVSASTPPTGSGTTTNEGSGSSTPPVTPPAEPALPPPEFTPPPAESSSTPPIQ